MTIRRVISLVGFASIGLMVLAGCEPDAATKAELQKQKTIIMAQAKENEDLAAQVEQLSVMISNLRREVEARDRKIAVLREGLDKLRNTSVLSDKVQHQLEILAEKFGGVLQGNRLQLPGDYLFDAGQFELSKQSRDLLSQLTDILKGEDLVLLIVGHTDSDPVVRAKKFGIKDNLHLSLMRAYSVVNAMKGYGYPQNRMYPTGWGDLFPIASNKTKDGKRLNRRVEILIDPAASGLFPISAIYDVEGPEGNEGGVVIEK
ncbi:MAG: OmpA family protein [Planctomycetes bacterium]|nr:OmpA family protein [Planctomycetota bacterium]